MLGFYITGHPLDHYVADLPRLTTTTTESLAAMSRSNMKFGQEVVIGGVVSALRERPLKSGNGRMAFITLEDLQGSCEILVFSKVFAEAEAAIKSQEPILVRGQPMVEGDDDDAGEVKIRAKCITLLGDERMRHTKTLSLKLPLAQLDDKLLAALREALSSHRGEVPVTLTLNDPNRFELTMSTSQLLRVSPSDALMARLETLVGRACNALG